MVFHFWGVFIQAWGLLLRSWKQTNEEDTIVLAPELITHVQLHSRDIRHKSIGYERIFFFQQAKNPKGKDIIPRKVHLAPHSFQVLQIICSLKLTYISGYTYGCTTTTHKKCMNGEWHLTPTSGNTYVHIPTEKTEFIRLAKEEREVPIWSLKILRTQLATNQKYIGANSSSWRQMVIQHDSPVFTTTTASQRIAKKGIS